LNICVQRVKVDYISFSKYNSRYDPAPSQEDIHVTRRLVEAGKIMGIELLDHLVIGNHSFTSLKEKGYL